MPTEQLFEIEFTFKPLTPECWHDFEQLFEEHGIQNGCWCMYWRAKRAECQRGFGEGNKQAFKAIVESGKVTGIVAYHQDRAVAWCSIAPRDYYPVLERSRMLKRVNDEPVWSITCFFVSKSFRRKGMTEILIEAAIEYARQRGAKIVESYPLQTEITKLLPYERYMGIQSTFERLGFHEVARRSERRSIMRYYIEKVADEGTAGHSHVR
jgi:GNAT superfamily N-acetyltransferase